MPIDPNQAWKDRNRNMGDNDLRRTNSYTNPLAGITGAVTGGNWDPASSLIHNNVGGPQKNAGLINWQEGDQGVYSQMDKQQWDELAGKQPDYQRQWIETRKRWLKQGHDDQGNPVKPGTFYDPQTGQSGLSPEEQAAKAAQDKDIADGKAKEAAFQKWRADTMTRLDSFSKEMNMPVEELIKRGDLGVMNAGRNATSQAGSAAYGAGLGGGGVSSMNTQRAVTDAQSKYQLQRAQIGLGATNSLLGNMSDMAHSGEDTRRYEQGMNLQLQQAAEQQRQLAFSQKQAQAGKTMGLIGGGIGMMYGGPQGAAMGQSLGQGLGASSAGSYTPQGFSYPSGSSSPGSGGLGGRNPYGGSQ